MEHMQTNFQAIDLSLRRLSHGLAIGGLGSLLLFSEFGFPAQVMCACLHFHTHIITKHEMHASIPTNTGIYVIH
jgi:hypothetical protein